MIPDVFSLNCQCEQEALFQKYKVKYISLSAPTTKLHD